MICAFMFLVCLIHYFNSIFNKLKDFIELYNMYIEYQGQTYLELHSLVELAGGELNMTQYSRFLLDELYLGPFWAHLGLDLIYEE